MTASDKHSFPLLELPEKAIKSLLDHLNLWNLMSLRLVCKKTKSWVEESQAISRFCVYVNERKFLKKLGKSGVRWSNLCITCDADSVSSAWINLQEYGNIFSKLNQSLKILKLVKHRLSYEGLVILLKHCPNLISLELGTLDLKNVEIPLSSIVQDGTNSLEKLAVSFVAWENEKDLQFFSEVLKHCKKLKFFKIPYILSTRLYSIYPDLEEEQIEMKEDEICNEMLYKPIISILKERLKYSLKELDVENYFLSQLMSNIVPACKDSGCLIVNVMEDFENDLTEDEKDSLSDIIGSLLNCTKYLCFDKLHKLKSVNISKDNLETSDIDKKHASAPLPYLQSVTLPITKSVLVSERLASCFLQARRESMKTVHVTFEGLSDSAQISIFRPIKFASSLPNLHTLHLEGFSGKTSDYLMFWSNFSLLEDVSLLNCQSLCDEAFDSKTGSAFMSLKHLRKMTLEDAEVTDATLKNTLAKMPLEVLILSLPKISFDGLTSLASGQLTRTLMVFHCTNPDDYRDDFFKEYFKQFKNLKKYEILF